MVFFFPFISRTTFCKLNVTKTLQRVTMVDSDGSTNKPKQPSSISVIAEKKQKQKERNQLWTTKKVTKHI